MEVITLVGKSNSGKTTTLKELIIRICNPVYKPIMMLVLPLHIITKQLVLQH